MNCAWWAISSLFQKTARRLLAAVRVLALQVWPAVLGDKTGRAEATWLLYPLKLWHRLNFPGVFPVCQPSLALGSSRRPRSVCADPVHAERWLGGSCRFLVWCILWFICTASLPVSNVQKRVGRVRLLFF